VPNTPSETAARSEPLSVISDTALAQWRSGYKAKRLALVEQFNQGAQVRTLTDGLARATDDALKSLWNHYRWPAGCALIAVGGFGRAELFPGSDVDILLLLPPLDSSETLVPSPAAFVASQVEQFVSLCWDLGLEIGHSVRTVEQCLHEAAQDITVQTSLLEARWLIGSRAAFTELGKRLNEARDAQQFFQAKQLELAQRHAKFEDTPYSLEPNVKESPGGLRDLQTVLWVTRAAGLGESWHDLANNGLLSAREARVLVALDYFLKLTRARLHVLARRREDRLVFDLQAPMATRFDVKANTDRRSSELLMQRYYRVAKQVTQATALLMQAIEERLFPANTGVPERLDAEFRVRRNLLDVYDVDLFEREPSAILRAFVRYCEHRKLEGMTGTMLQAMWRARTRIDSAFRADPVNRQLFMQLMRQDEGITHALRLMNQWSILGRYIPAFRRIVGRMQHDLFHVYTVDQHILTVVRNLRRFAIDEHAHEYPRCSELMARFDKPWLLYLAALFHDIAKGRGGDHSKLGKVDAARFGATHGLSAEEIDLLTFLVEHHLTMSSVAQKQDLSDPDVIAEFAQTVANPYRLHALYLLTVADIRGTSPKVWNNWKGKLLEELLDKAHRVLAGDKATHEGQMDIHQRQAHALLALYGLSAPTYQPFWNQLDVNFFSRNDPQDIAWQTRVLYGHIHATKAIVRARLSPHGEGFQVVVYVKDQAELFARICGYFDSQNISVLDARVSTTAHRYALDYFVVTSSDFADRYRDILQMVEHDLALWIDSVKPLSGPVRGRASRRSRYFPTTPKVSLRPDERSQRYYLNISAGDRTGLLFSIAKVMAQHNVNLHMARISTLGERVEDTFVIEGPHLANQRQQLAFEEDLLSVLAVS
jgi:[protein-PII] uridylyltransferase